MRLVGQQMQTHSIIVVVFFYCRTSHQSLKRQVLNENCLVCLGAGCLLGVLEVSTWCAWGGVLCLVCLWGRAPSHPRAMSHEPNHEP